MQLSLRTLLAASALALCLGAADATPYLLSGTAADGQPYSGRGELTPQGHDLQILRSTSRGVLRGRLRWKDGVWVGQLLARAGARGALEGFAHERVEATLHPTPEGYRLEWRDPAGRSGQELWRGALPTPTGLSPLALDVYAHALAAADRGAVPAELLTSGGNHVSPRVLETGPQIFAAAADLIAGAEREVLIQTYFWKTPCQAGDLIFAGLKRLEQARREAGAEAPVDVFVAVNKHWTTRSNVKNLERDVAAAAFDPRYLRVHTAGFKQRIYGNLHSKAFVVDGARALVTSANVHAAQDAPTPWYECGYLLEGPVGSSLRAEFADLWQRATQGPLPAPAPPLHPGFRDGVPVAVVTRLAAGSPFSNKIDDPAAQSYVSAFRGAKRWIRILTPHLNHEVLRRELVEAARRGVSIQVVVSKGKGRLRVSLPFQGGTNARAFKRLREALRDEPAALARLDLRWFSTDGVTPIEGDGVGVNHAKYVTVDGELAIVGSSNHDAEAINHSRELNVAVADPETVAAWDAQIFEPAFARAIPAE